MKGKLETWVYKEPNKYFGCKSGKQKDYMEQQPNERKRKSSTEKNWYNRHQGPDLNQI